MVVKTELCAFSEYRIYPGHGSRFIRKDGQPVLLSTHKCKSLLHQKKRPALLTWTQAWRRLNKKGKDEGVARKKSRKTVKVQRAIVGASLDDIAKRRAAPKPKVVSAATEAALKEVKARAKQSSSGVIRQPSANVPKIQRSVAHGNMRAGAKR